MSKLPENIKPKEYSQNNKHIKKPKINYFDLGLHKEAEEIDMFLEICKKNNYDYCVYGFEAHPDYCKNLVKKYKNDNNIQIINAAIYNKNTKTKLYISETSDGAGNSLFKSKNNINIDNYVLVNAILFSDWIKNNVKNYKKFLNILRFNIEGSEWYLINDLDKTNTLKYFKIILGTNDMSKVSTLHNKINKYNETLKRNNINTYRFCGNKPEKNCDLTKLISKNFGLE